VISVVVIAEAMWAQSVYDTAIILENAKMLGACDGALVLTSCNAHKVLTVAGLYGMLEA